MSSKSQKKHSWKFFKSGGIFQANIVSGEDIKHIDELDQKLWSALSCPTKGLFFDEKTLSLIDSDGDARIRHNDIIAISKWTCSMLKDCQTLMAGSDSLELSNIDDSTPEGAALLLSARGILKTLGKPESPTIAVSDFGDVGAVFANTPFNADGVITTLSCGDDADLQKLVDEISAFGGAKADRSGKSGIDADMVKAFFDSATAYKAWLDAGEANLVQGLGDKTASAYESFKAIEAKVDDFFTRVEILACEPDAAASLNADTTRIREITGGEISASNPDLASLPIAKISALKELNLEGNLNPAWSDKVANFSREVAQVILGKSVLSKEDWLSVKSAFKPYATWLASKPNSKISELAPDRLAQIISENRISALMDLFVKEDAVKTEVEGIDNVEKLVRLHKNLAELVKNFVSFQNFYSKEDLAIFQFGSLYIDRRVCRLCVKVENVAAHSAMATLSYGYLIYCTCKRKGEADMNIVALVSAGDSDNIIVGRNGVFYDRKGNDWDATITKIVDSPIGIGQAFLSPYKRLAKWISEQIAKRAAALDSSAMKNLESGNVVKQQEKKVDVGMIAALGVAVGGITTAFGMLLDAFLGMGYWIPLGVIAILLSISAPSMLLAYLRLRMRNLAPILDGNGWAVNSKAAVNMTFGASLTKMGRLPLGAYKGGVDPFADPNPTRKIIAVIAVVLALGLGAMWYCNVLSVFGWNAPSWSHLCDKDWYGKAENSSTTTTTTTTTTTQSAGATKTVTTAKPAEAPKAK